MQQQNVPVYILAGGRSARFGQDKARVLVAGEPLLLQVSRVVRPFASSITVVAKQAGAYQDLGCRTLGDQDQDRGPLGGLNTALCDMNEGWLLLLACDWLGLQPSWIEALLAQRFDLTVNAVAYRLEKWEPLLALYHTRLKQLVSERLALRQLALWRLLEQGPTRRLEPPPDWSMALQVNSPEDLQAFLKGQVARRLG